MLEYRREAARLVIDTGPLIVHAAKELSRRDLARAAAWRKCGPARAAAGLNVSHPGRARAAQIASVELRIWPEFLKVLRGRETG